MEYVKILSNYLPIGGLSINPVASPTPSPLLQPVTPSTQQDPSVLRILTTLFPDPSHTPDLTPSSKLENTDQIKKKRRKKAKKLARASRVVVIQKMPTNLDYQEEGGSEASIGSLSSRNGDGDGGQAAITANTAR